MDQQAQQLWKMLDDMADNNPEAYKEFVKNNIQSGVKEMQEKKQKQLDDLTIEPATQYVFKVYANLFKQAIQTDLEQKLSLNDNEVRNEQHIVSKLDKRVKLYFNVLTHDRVIGALDNNNNPTTDASKYHCIPISFSKAITSKSSSLGHAVYFYDLVLNEKTFTNINKTILQTIILDTAEKRIQLDRNPLEFKFHRCYYQFDRKSTTILKNKQYRSKDKISKVKLVLEQSTDTQQTNKQDIRQYLKETPQIMLHEQLPKQDLIIQPSQEQKKPSKPLIVEVEPSQVDISYSLTHESNNSIAILILPQVGYLRDLDLQISAFKLKLTTIHGKTLNIDLPYRVDDNNPSAKWDKKKQQLKVTLNKYQS